MQLTSSQDVRWDGWRDAHPDCLSLSTLLFFPGKKNPDTQAHHNGIFLVSRYMRVCCVSRRNFLAPALFHAARGGKGVFFSMSRIDRCGGGKKLLGGESSSELCVCIIFFASFCLRICGRCPCVRALFFFALAAVSFILSVYYGASAFLLYTRIILARRGGRSALKLFYLFSVAFFLSKASLL